jgi:hypothetical protein
MSVSYKSSPEDKASLLAENTNWRACVEQVILLLDTRKDPDTGSIAVWLIRWLNEPKNNRRATHMSLENIIEIGKRELNEKN